MTTTTESLVTLVAQLLGQPRTADPPTYPTGAGARVYAPRDWPTADSIYPAIFVSGPRERKQSLGSAAAPEFEVTSTIRVAARTNALGASSDGNIATLLETLGSLRRQVEVALINNPALMGLLEQIGSVTCEIAFKATGEEHLGEMLMELELVYYQGPEDFFEIDGAPLTEVTLATQYPQVGGVSPGFSLTIPQDS